VLVDQLAQLQKRVQQSSSSGVEEIALVEMVIDEMARRQGHRIGPYFEWSLATPEFTARFADACGRILPQFSAAEFARAFVDQWPPGEFVLRVEPRPDDPITLPPHADNGFWPARLPPRA
jgi:hypothetical protein